MSYDSAVKAIGFRSSELRNVKSIYLQVCKVLKDYSFSGVKDAEQYNKGLNRLDKHW